VPAFSYPAFEYPRLLPAMALALLPLIPGRSKPLPAFVSFPIPGGAAFPRTLRQKMIWLPRLFRILALALLVFGAAGPHWGAVRMTDETRGIAIEMVIDRSSSMSLTDLEYRNRRSSRLDAVKAVSREFLLGNGSDLKGRSGDAIGLVEFAAHPQNLSPLVSHNEALLARKIDEVEVAQGMEDATAIGDAVAMAAARIRSTEEARAISFRSKIIVLLTDGQENSGSRQLGDAARLAARWNVRIYAVGIRPTPEGAEREDQIGYGLDALASATGGMAVVASDGAGLRQFFSAIDRLEPNTIPSTGLNGGFDATGISLITAFSLVCGETLLRLTWMRATP